MQYSNSIDDYVTHMLDGNNGGYANDWLVGDNKTGEVARFELGLQEHTRRAHEGRLLRRIELPGRQDVDREGDDLQRDERGQLGQRAPRAVGAGDGASTRARSTPRSRKRLESDDYDLIAKKARARASGRSAAPSRRRRAAFRTGTGRAYFPGGTVQAKVTTATMAEKMQLWARDGPSVRPDFIASDFLAAHPQFAWARGLLRDMKTQPWTEFTSGMK